MHSRRARYLSRMGLGKAFNNGNAVRDYAVELVVASTVEDEDRSNGSK